MIGYDGGVRLGETADFESSAGSGYDKRDAVGMRGKWSLDDSCHFYISVFQIVVDVSKTSIVDRQIIFF